MIVVIRYFTQVKKHLLYNPSTRESVEFYCNYLGFSEADLFIGVKSIEKINGGKVFERKLPMSPFIQSLSNLCILLPVVTFISIITGVIASIAFFSTNILMSVTFFVGAILIGLFIYIVSIYLENLFVYSLPERNGWLKAYIDDYGKVVTPDRMTGKTIPLTIEADGKKSIHMVDQEENDKLVNAFFGKNGIFEKKKE